MEYLGKPPHVVFRRDYYRRLVRDAVMRLAEREKEVALELLLGSRPARPGEWGVLRGHEGGGVAHYWIVRKIEGFDVQLAVCGRHRLGRYGWTAASTTGDGPFRVVHDAGTRKRVCHVCVYLADEEGA